MTGNAPPRAELRRRVSRLPAGRGDIRAAEQRDRLPDGAARVRAALQLIAETGGRNVEALLFGGRAGRVPRKSIAARGDARRIAAGAARLLDRAERAEDAGRIAAFGLPDADRGERFVRERDL